MKTTTFSQVISLISRNKLVTGLIASTAIAGVAFSAFGFRPFAPRRSCSPIQLRDGRPTIDFNPSDAFFQVTIGEINATYDLAIKKARRLGISSAEMERYLRRQDEKSLIRFWLYAMGRDINDCSKSIESIKYHHDFASATNTATSFERRAESILKVSSFEVISKRFAF